MSAAEPNVYKRPASPVGELSMPPAKIPKISAGQLQINYLKREKKETIPLATADEPLPRLLRLVAEYDGVLQRHESLAGNLGACPVGPILLKRFERLFEGPPRILKSNSRDPNITWLDVVEFAQNKPEQFDLEKTRNGIRVCQFYLKQCRVEISEEDYVLIRSGMPQKLIPPQPILEDEEKELGVIDVLDRNLGKVVHSADQVSARARQLIHRLKNRRAAIIARRESEGDVHKNVLKSNDLPPSPAFDHNGFSQRPAPVPIPMQSPSMPSSGFTAVNPRHSLPGPESASIFSTPREVHREPILNGTPTSTHIASVEKPTIPAPGEENWMNKFLTPSERAAGMTADTIRRETLTASSYRSNSREETTPVIDDSMRLSMNARRPESRRQSEGAISEHLITDLHTSSVPIPNTPASLIPQQKPHMWNRDDGGPYKVEMISRMETMKRGERVIPPCDRCRRLHMDCIKNLTACLGCTKKHAKCSWKDVSLDELESTAPAARERAAQDETTAPSSSEWDNMLNQHKREPDQLRDSPSSPPVNDPMDISSNKESTPHMPSPPNVSLNPIPNMNLTPNANQISNQNGNSNGDSNIVRTASQPHESPRLDVRPPPLDQPQREPGEDQASKSYPRYVPFKRPPGQWSPIQNRSKEEGNSDEGDRLAAIASQVYRTASQNVTGPNEPAS